MTMLAVKTVIHDALQAAIPDGGDTVSRWAETCRYVSEERSARPGKWSNELVPFLVEIMDSFSQADVREIVFQKSSQVAGTEFIVNCIGYRIDRDPGPMMYIAEQETKARAFTEEALDPTIMATPVLRQRVFDVGQKTSNNNQQVKRFTGGRLNIGWASSPAQLSSRPARDVFCDEVDAFEATSEGNPVKLAEARTKTFNETKKIVMVSSPRNAETSIIEPRYLLGDQREYYVPCPQCSEYQTLKWANVKWEDGEPESAYMVCEVNGCIIENDDKPEMLERGRWIAGADFKGIASFKISELYSPFTSWGDMATDFLVAKKHTDTLKVFVNTRLGETWKEEEQIDYLDLQLHKEEYGDVEVPDGVLVLTAGVDVQIDRLEYEIVGWGVDRENWSIDRGVLQGSPSFKDVWDDLEDVLSRTYAGRDRKWKVSAAAIDSGGSNTDDVYGFIKRNKGRRWFAVKGSSSPGNPLVKKGSLSKKERVRIWMVGTDTAKDEIFSFLRVEDPGTAGCCHFPKDDERYGEDFIEQLCSEKKTTRFKMGRSYSIYEKVSPNVRNEALDIRVYATAARGIIVPNYDKWAERQAKKRLKPKPDEEPKQQRDVSEPEPEAVSPAAEDPPSDEGKKEAAPIPKRRGRLRIKKSPFSGFKV